MKNTRLKIPDIGVSRINNKYLASLFLFIAKVVGGDQIIERVIDRHILEINRDLLVLHFLAGLEVEARLLGKYLQDFVERGIVKIHGN